jgi:hypothetical protein
MCLIILCFVAFMLRIQGNLSLLRQVGTNKYNARFDFRVLKLGKIQDKKGNMQKKRAK